MKIALIVFLAKYYSRVSTYDVSSIKFIILPMFAIFIPVLLVAEQPDLGTAALIAIGGIAVIWMTGFRIKFLQHFMERFLPQFLYLLRSIFFCNDKRRKKQGSHYDNISCFHTNFLHSIESKLTLLLL